MSYLSVVIIIVVLLGVGLLGARARRRTAATQQMQREGITVGNRVMTTSGLYGTVVGLNSDDTVQLAIAPGVEVTWAIAALRDIASLPSRYRQPLERPSGDQLEAPEPGSAARPVEPPDGTTSG